MSIVFSLKALCLNGLVARARFGAAELAVRPGSEPGRAALRVRVPIDLEEAEEQRYAPMIG